MNRNKLSVVTLPSWPKLLPVSAPLGDVRESFPSYGSRLSKAILDDPAIYFHTFSLIYSRNISLAKVFVEIRIVRICFCFNLNMPDDACVRGENKNLMISAILVFFLGIEAPISKTDFGKIFISYPRCVFIWMSSFRPPPES